MACSVYHSQNLNRWQNGKSKIRHQAIRRRILPRFLMKKKTTKSLYATFIASIVPYISVVSNLSHHLIYHLEYPNIITVKTCHSKRQPLCLDLAEFSDTSLHYLKLNRTKLMTKLHRQNIVWRGKRSC